MIVAVAHLGHLARRFGGSLVPGGPRPADEEWAAGILGPGELGLWRAMSGADRRHAVGVARRVATALGIVAGPPVLAAALLHDVGKLDAGLGTFGRVGATLAGMAGRRQLTPRIARHLDHGPIGADMLARAGSDPLTVTWAAEHHLPASRWTLDPTVAAALKAADDD